MRLAELCGQSGRISGARTDLAAVLVELVAEEEQERCNSSGEDVSEEAEGGSEDDQIDNTHV